MKNLLVAAAVDSVAALANYQNARGFNSNGQNFFFSSFPFIFFLQQHNPSQLLKKYKKKKLEKEKQNY